MGAALCLLLPETLNRTLPSSLADGENFGAGEKFYHFACFDRKNVSESTTILHQLNSNGTFASIHDDNNSSRTYT